MPIIAGLEAAPRRSASHGKPRRTSTSSQEERRRLVAHCRSRSFSNLEFVLDDGGDGGSADGRQMPQHGQEQRRSRGHHHRLHYQPTVVDIGCRGVVGVGLRRRSSFSYYRLPEHQLSLTIVKLDRSTFDVQVMRSASVAELKLAVEEIFIRSPTGQGEISWSLVWGHFCLCYLGQKLIDDKASLSTFGIKDEDELHFIRHVSINYDSNKQRPRKRGGISEQHKIGWSHWTRSEVNQESEKDGTDNEAANECSNNFTDDHYDHDESDDSMPHLEFKLAHPLRGWLSYSGLWSSGKRTLGTMG